MADFCQQCSIELFGQDTKDLANLGESLEEGEGFLALCEDCGYTLVDLAGKCLCNCIKHHNPTRETNA